MRNFKSTPPDDSLSDDFTTCSEWCHAKWSQALDRGDQNAANVYLELYNLWKSRGQ